MSLPVRVAIAKALLEEAAAEYDDLSAEKMVNLQEAIEFLDRLEASLSDERSNE